MVYELTNWSRNTSNDFAIEIVFFGTIKLTRNAIKSEFVYNCQGIAFDGAGSRSFDNDFA